MPSNTALTDNDGHFRRKESQFRNAISKGGRHPPEKDRYVLYLNYGCPWAHRTNIVRSLKGLDHVIQLIVMGIDLGPDGWLFDGKYGSEAVDPLYGVKSTRELYQRADPTYTGKYTVPCLWDKKLETVVNNESSEIIRMFYREFDEFLPEDRRESSSPLLPQDLRHEIEALNEWVYDTVNNGVYKCGFTTSQEAYDKHIYPLFDSLDRIEEHLGQPGHGPLLFGDHVTEADIRLYPTIARFDLAYYNIFRCNLKMIRTDYPLIERWWRRLYFDRSSLTNGGAFGKTTDIKCIKHGYAKAKKLDVCPAGPLVEIVPWDEKKDGKLNT